VNHHTPCACCRIIKEAGWPSACAVKKLIRHDDIAGFVFQLQAPAGADRNQVLNAQFLESVDVRSAVKATRRDAMSTSMSGQKRDRLSLNNAYHIGIRRRAEGRVEAHLSDVLKLTHVIDATAAYNPNAYLLHR